MSRPEPLRLLALSTTGRREEVAVPVAAAFNFGYAARDQAGVAAHVAECAARGIPAPQTVPALYPLLPERVTTAATIAVAGETTYAEAEYALVLAPGGRWLITAASDHSDAVVERASVARAKNAAPDLLAREAWWLDEVEEGLDGALLTLERTDGARPEPVQRGTLAELLAPRALIELLARRLGRAPVPGTVALSGTLGGEPPLDAARWRVTLADAGRARRLTLDYAVRALPGELGDPAPPAAN